MPARRALYAVLDLATGKVIGSLHQRHRAIDTPHSVADVAYVDRLTAAATGYVRCAATHRPLFQVLFGVGLDKSHHPEIDVAARPVADAFLTPARAIRPDKTEAYELTLAVIATAHGHASLLLDGAFGQGPDAVDAATRRAATVTCAIIAGWA